MEKAYVVVTPLRNEAATIGTTIQGVLRQTVKPVLWLILGDGSTDESYSIIRSYAETNDWIRLVELEDRGFDLVGHGVAEVMNRGLEMTRDVPAPFFCKLDGDIDLPHDYFETLLTHMDRDPSLAIASGHPFVYDGADKKREQHSAYFPAGPARLYRKAYLDEIGPFVSSVGWDTVDILRMRMRGYNTAVVQDLEFHHMRRMGTRQGFIDGMVRDGRNAYLTGYSPLFFVCRALFNMRHRPYLLRTACMLWGFAAAHLSGRKRIVSREELHYHRRFQLRRFLFWQALVICPALLASAPLTLRNESLSLVLETDGGARISSISSAGSPRNLIHGSAVPLYQVVLAGGAGATRTFDSRQASQTRVVEATSEKITLQCSHAGDGIELLPTVTLSDRNGYAEFSLKIRHSRNAGKVGLVRYPGYGVDMSGNSSAVLMPVAEGCLIRQPARTLAAGEERGYDYPGLASMQLMAAYDSEGGLFSYATDSRGFYKRLSLRRLGTAGLLLFEHITLHETQPEFAIPYTVRVGPFQGDWTAAADAYKTWASQQFWCEELLEDRVLPRSLASPAFYLGVNCRGANGRDGESLLPLAGGLAAGWQSGLGIPVRAILLGWEKHGPWITPDYFPPFGGAASFRKAVGSTGSAMAFLSGLNVTLERAARKESPGYRMPPDEARAYEKAAIVGRDGKPGRLGKRDGPQGDHLRLCPAVPESWKALRSAAAELASAGVDVIQIDQIPGGGSPPCFARSHGHPPAGGSTVFDSVSRNLAEIGKIVRSNRPGAAVALECPGELYIPYVDIFHCREYMQGLWPREKAGEEVVPLFSYLYHEYALGYGGDSAPFVTSRRGLEAAVFAQAANLRAGRDPGAAVWTKNASFSELDRSLRQFMTSAAGALNSEAGKSLRYGRMLPITGPEAEKRRIEFTAGGKDLSFSTPSVLTSAFQARDGSAAVLYINVSDRKAVFPVALPAALRSKRATVTWPVSENKELISEGHRLTLDPFTITVLGFRGDVG